MGVRLIGRELGFKDVREAFERDGRAEFASRFISMGYWFFERGSCGVFLGAIHSFERRRSRGCGADYLVALACIRLLFFSTALPMGLKGFAAQARKALDMVAFKRWVLNVVVISAGLGDAWVCRSSLAVNLYTR